MGSSPFARRYLGNRVLLSFPPGTEMFHFPGFAALTLSGLGLSVVIPPTGFPIRRSRDQRLPGTSPGLIAARPRPSSPPGPEASTLGLSLFGARKLESKKKAKNFSSFSFLIFFLKNFHWLHWLHWLHFPIKKAAQRRLFFFKATFGNSIFFFLFHLFHLFKKIN